MLKFKRQLMSLAIGKYKGRGKFEVERHQEVVGYAYGDNPLFGYCQTSPHEPDHEDNPWTIVHIKTGFTIVYCTSEKRCRTIIKEMEEKYRAIFEFDTVPGLEYFKQHKPIIAHIKALAKA